MNLDIPIYCSVCKMWNTSDKNALAGGKLDIATAFYNIFEAVCLTVAKFPGVFAKFASFSFYLSNLNSRMDLNGTSHCQNVAVETFLRGDGRNYTFNNHRFKKIHSKCGPQGE